MLDFRPVSEARQREREKARQEYLRQARKRELKELGLWTLVSIALGVLVIVFLSRRSLPPDRLTKPLPKRNQHRPMMGWYREIKGQDVGLEDYRDAPNRYNFQLNSPGRWVGPVPKNLIAAAAVFERRSEFGIVLRDGSKKTLKIPRHIENRYDANVAEEIPIKQWPAKLKVGTDTVYRFRALEAYDWISFGNSCLARPGSITVIGKGSDSVHIGNNFGTRVWYVGPYVDHKGKVLTKPFFGPIHELRKMENDKWRVVISDLPHQLPPFRPLPVLVGDDKQRQRAFLVREHSDYCDPKLEKKEVSKQARAFVRAIFHYYELEFKETPKFKVDQAVYVEFEPFPFR